MMIDNYMTCHWLYFMSSYCILYCVSKTEHLRYFQQFRTNINTNFWYRNEFSINFLLMTLAILQYVVKPRTSWGFPLATKVHSEPGHVTYMLKPVGAILLLCLLIAIWCPLASRWVRVSPKRLKQETSNLVHRLTWTIFQKRGDRGQRHMTP